MNMKYSVGVVTVVAVLGLATTAAGQSEAPKKPRPNDNYDALFQQYLTAVRSASTTAPESQWMAGLFGDLRARRVNDLLTINVVEAVSAQGSADSSLDKSSQASAAVPNFFAKVPGFLNPSELAQLGTSTNFKGGGSTTRSGTLQAVITARVAEVFPNGDLGIEGVREIDINGDRQMIVVTGVVRAVDVMAGNIVPSTAIGQMRIRYFGNGLIKDNLNPGWLVRILNKIF